MKFLTDRTEIAKFFNENPVIRINAETPHDADRNSYKGELVKVLTPTKNHPDLFDTGHLYHYKENGKDSFVIIGGGAILSGSFGYNDVLERYEWNHAPVISEGCTVGVLEDFPSKQECRIRVMKATGCGGMRMYSTCYLKDVE